MNRDPARLRATPFHTRAAEANEANDWTARGGFALARAYAGSRDEALAARFRAGMIDISWRWRMRIEGERASEFLSCLLTRNVARLPTARAVKALWLADRGGVRGAGVLARYGRQRFLLAAAAPDAEWIGAAARCFGVEARDYTSREGGLAVVGPYAAAVLSQAGLAPDLAPLAFARRSWRGLAVTLSRWGEHGGYELWCAADDAVIVWDRLMRAGAPYGLEPVGLAAADLLDIEAGVPRPGRDYGAATAPDAAGPTPLALGLESLIDDGHKAFNGRGPWAAARASERERLVGIAIDSRNPAAHTPLIRSGVVVGHTMSSAYSPALRRAIALARVDEAVSAPGTEFAVILYPANGDPSFRTVAARVTALPFLPAPDPIRA